MSRTPSAPAEDFPVPLPSCYPPQLVILIHALCRGTGSVIGRVYHEMVTITPEKAELLLAHNRSNNRTPTAKDVDKYARIIAANAWEPDASTIDVSEDGEMINGQHRNMACVKAGVPFTTTIRFGVSLAAAAHLNVGKEARVADILWQEHPELFDTPTEAGDVSGILDRVLRLNSTSSPVNPNVVLAAHNHRAFFEIDAEFLPNAELYREARKYALKIAPMYTGTKLTKPVIGAAAYVILESDLERGRRFLDEWSDTVPPSNRVRAFSATLRKKSELTYKEPGYAIPKALWKETAFLSFIFHAFNLWRANPNAKLSNGIGACCDLQLNQSTDELVFQFPKNHPRYVSPKGVSK